MASYARRVMAATSEVETLEPVMFDRELLSDANGRLVCRCRCVDNHPIVTRYGKSLACAVWVEAGDVCAGCAAAFLAAHPAETNAVHNRARRVARA